MSLLFIIKYEKIQSRVYTNRNFYLGDIGVHLKQNGEISLAFPAKKIGENKIGIYHPINKDTEETIKRAVEEKMQGLNLF